MRTTILLLIYTLAFFQVTAQGKWQPQNITLDNSLNGKEFSGLAKWKDKILFIPQKESFLLYADSSTIVAAKNNNTPLQLNKIAILDYYRLKNTLTGFDGIEAAVVNGDSIYLAIESKGATCYLVKGRILTNPKSKQLYIDCYMPKKKLAYCKLQTPTDGGRLVPNAGFESLAQPKNGELLTIFELNHLQANGTSAIYTVPENFSKVNSIVMDSVDFRITDACTEHDTLYALNTWWKNESNMNYTLLPAAYKDTPHNGLHRIIRLYKDGSSNKYTWEVADTLRTDANWEGIYRFDKGFLIVSDDGQAQPMLLQYLSPGKAVTPAAPIAAVDSELKDWTTIAAVTTVRKPAYTHAKGRNGNVFSVTETKCTDETRIKDAAGNESLIQNRYTIMREVTYHLENGQTTITEKATIKDIKWSCLTNQGSVQIPLPKPYTRRFPDFTQSTSGATVPDTLRSAPYIRDTDIVKKQALRKTYAALRLEYDRPMLCMGIGYMPASAYRNLQVATPQLQDQHALQYRQKEYSIYGQAFTGSIGITLNSRKSLNLEYIHIRQGFAMDSLSHDWHTGTDTFSTQNHEYRIYSHGIGLVFRHSGYGAARFNAAYELGVYNTFTTLYTANGDKYDKGAGIKQQGLRIYNFTGKLAAGFNWRPDYRYELRVMPTLYYNFATAAKGTILSEHLFNAGVTVAFVYTLMCD